MATFYNAHVILPTSRRSTLLFTTKIPLCISCVHLDFQCIASPPSSHRMFAKRAAALAAKAQARTMASGKDVKFGAEARALMLAGVDKLADAVQVRI